MYLYTSMVEQEQSHHAKCAATWLCCGSTMQTSFSLGISTPYPLLCLREHTRITLSTQVDTNNVKYCRIKIMYLSRILLKSQTCLESSLLTQQHEFGPIYILMIIMDTAVFIKAAKNIELLYLMLLLTFTNFRRDNAQANRVGQLKSDELH